MKISCAYGLWVGLVLLAAGPVMVNADEHARKELIERNKDHPYPHPQKPVYGGHQKAEHDKEIFEEMDTASDEAKERHAQEAVEAVERASIRLQENGKSR